MVLNYGFMQVRIPPTGGGGVPIGELVLLLTLISINYTKLLPKLFSLLFAYPFFVWWGLGIGRAFLGVPNYGMWALRDAVHVLESLFLLAGFAFAAKPEMVDRFFGWLSKLMVMVVVYAATSPFSDVLTSISPTIVAGNGEVVSILFSYSATGYGLVMAAAYVLIFQKEIRVPIIHHYPTVIAAGLWGYAAGIFSGRTVYLQIIAVIILFALYRSKLSSRALLAIVLLLGMIALLPELGLQIKGNRGEISIQFLIDHFLSIGGVASSDAAESVKGAASGFDQRMDWWISIYQRLTSDIWNLLFGLGYGFPLTKFSYYGVIAREPHNSYISILARIGLIGGIAWIWMHAQMLRVWHSGYRQCVRMGWHTGQNRLLILMVFFIMIWVLSIGEDGFEKPYNVIPYYFFWGIALRYVDHIRNGRICSDVDGKL